MKFKSTTISFIFLLVFIPSIAQVKDQYKILKITLDSDSSTKSVLVSNVMEEKSGDMSPVIGAANWIENGKELKCNSFLEFDFNLLPVEILNNPLLILRAELILHPINVEFAINDNEKKSAIYIKQVLDKWEDSSTMWNNQPNSNVYHQVSAILETKSKNIATAIDITEIVFHYFMEEKNNGFLIAYDENFNNSFAAGQLFASPKNENPSIRPQLVIYIADPADKQFTKRISSLMPVNINEIDINNKWKREREYYYRNNIGHLGILAPINNAAPQSVYPHPSKVVN